MCWLDMSENETVSQTSVRPALRVSVTDIAAKLLSEPKIREELQSWIDEIAASGPPWANYLRARQMGLLSEQFRIVDLALETGLVKIRSVA